MSMIALEIAASEITPGFLYFDKCPAGRPFLQEIDTANLENL
jgi:hypothetical protein